MVGIGRTVSQPAPATVVVTGASGGIGRATALAFAARGDRVALIARGAHGLNAAAADVRRAGGTPLILPTDVADAEAVDAAASTVEQEFGPIDVWVNVAFTSVFSRFHELTAAEYARITQVAYLGFVHGTMAALSRMRPRDRGVIVQAGSALGRRGIPLQSAYCGAKHAVKGFTEAVHTELLSERSGVRITRVDLPGVNTPQFSWVRNKLAKRPQPVAPIYSPAFMANCLVHASAHPRRRAWWIGTPTVYTVLGNLIAPQLVDAYLARFGTSGQLTEQDSCADDPDNLYEPADADVDFGAQGRFTDQQWEHDLQVCASRHHGLTFGLPAAAAVLSVLRKVRRAHR